MDGKHHLDTSRFALKHFLSKEVDQDTLQYVENTLIPTAASLFSGCVTKRGRCFHNAQTISYAHCLLNKTKDGLYTQHKLTYCEGFFKRKSYDTFIKHAWVSVNGFVLDTTIKQSIFTDDPLGIGGFVFGSFPDSMLYFGLCIDPCVVEYNISNKAVTEPLFITKINISLMDQHIV